MSQPKRIVVYYGDTVEIKWGDGSVTLVEKLREHDLNPPRPGPGYPVQVSVTYAQAQHIARSLSSMKHKHTRDIWERVRAALRRADACYREELQ